MFKLDKEYYNWLLKYCKILPSGMISVVMVSVDVIVVEEDVVSVVSDPGKTIL